MRHSLHSGVALLRPRDHYLVPKGMGGYQHGMIFPKTGLSGAKSKTMTSRVISQLVNGFVAVMLLSACAGTGQDQKQPVIVATKPVVQENPPEEPVIPRLKPKTPKKAPASPKLSEPTAEESASEANGAVAPVPDGHQQAIQQAGPGEYGPGEMSDTDPGAVDDLATLPTVPEVIQAEPEPVAPTSPDELKSKTETEVIKLLGRPVTTRSEGTGTVWTYRAEVCSLDVYFFLDVADNQRRALSYEMLPAWAEADGGQSCYTALKEAHNAQ